MVGNLLQMKGATLNSKCRLVISIPIIKELPEDPAWEKTEGEIGRHIARRLPEPKD
jgi:hypothetical protein